eukprot:GHVU01077870.1.p1 GENE.GHVU01077870.1~~GHVU01077870.1.p1  ORF type:complete len:201 (-),score=33.71 GHVU01077870.1:13-615(-)
MPNRPYDEMAASARGDGQERLRRAELHEVEASLKDWFLSRRIAMERNIAMKKLFDRYNLSGLGASLSQSSEVPVPQRVMWDDLVNGEPSLEDKLSPEAREMKADMYMRMFKGASDVSHFCRIPGVDYFKCLQRNFRASHAERTSACFPQFTSFATCRVAVKEEQQAAVRQAEADQDMEDRKAAVSGQRRVSDCAHHHHHH